MPLERASFDDVSERDLLDLIETGVPEGLAIEYKRDPYGNSDANKREALKDVTSFANSAGGHLIIGMEEGPAGIPKQLTGLPDVDLGGTIERMESLVRDGVGPRIVGIRMRPVATASGSAVVIRIPQSWNPPHRVSAAGTNRFYVRNSGGAHEASVEELRALFTLTADARQRMKDFRTDRIAKIVVQRGPVWLPAGRLFVHLMPLSAFGPFRLLDLERAYRERERFWPIGADHGMTPLFNLDGFINIRGGDVCHGYTQVFRNGIVEATKALIKVEVEQGEIVRGESVVQVVEAVPRYLAGLRALDVPPPVVVMISYQGIAGAKLGLNDWRMNDIQPFPPDDSLLLPEIILDDYGTQADIERALAPALDAFWNAAGFARCAYYDEEGNWRPPR
ncbi:MAG: ATP-binding protein [Bauldia sp.]